MIILQHCCSPNHTNAFHLPQEDSWGALCMNSRQLQISRALTWFIFVHFVTLNHTHIALTRISPSPLSDRRFSQESTPQTLQQCHGIQQSCSLFSGRVDWSAGVMVSLHETNSLSMTDFRQILADRLIEPFVRSLQFAPMVYLHYINQSM